MLDVKVKGVSSEHKRTKKERWRRKVLNILECQLETRPSPSRRTARLDMY